MIKEIGFSSAYMSPLNYRIYTLRPFCSFTIYTMHLFYDNVAPFLVDLWLSDHPQYVDIECLTEREPFNLVEDSLSNSLTGLLSL